MSDLDDLFNSYFSASEPLTSRERKELTRSILPELIDRGLNKSQAYSQFKERGLGINRAKFFNIYDEITGLSSDRIKYLSVRRDAVPSDNVFAPAKYNYSAKYRLDIEFYTYDIETDVKFIEIRSYSFNTKLTRGELEDRILEDKRDSLMALGFDVTGMKVIGAYINRNWKK